MPTYNHICQSEQCKHEWEDIYSITQDPPKICPKCNQETAKRVISDRGGPSKDVVELYGQDLVDKVKNDAQKLKSDAASKEKVYANLLGEERYHNLQTQMDRRKRR